MKTAATIGRSSRKMVRCPVCTFTATRTIREDGGYGACTRCQAVLMRVPSLAAKSDRAAKADLAQYEAPRFTGRQT